MKKLTLDVSKWRCGCFSTEAENCHGVGFTKLLNRDGYMCCLGQFSIQMGATRDEILDKPTPRSIKKTIPFLSVLLRDGFIEHTPFAREAMTINDQESTTIAQKIEALTQLCKENDIELIVINQDKSSNAANN